MLDDNESIARALRAIANPRRLTILTWLANPTAHFPPQRDGDLVKDGVCVGFITKKIGLSQPAVTEHMQLLAAAGLVSSKRIRNWVFYKLKDEEVSSVLKGLQDVLIVRGEEPGEKNG